MQPFEELMIGPPAGPPRGPHSAMDPDDVIEDDLEEIDEALSTLEHMLDLLL